MPKLSGGKWSCCYPNLQREKPSRSRATQPRGSPAGGGSYCFAPAAAKWDASHHTSFAVGACDWWSTTRSCASRCGWPAGGAVSAATSLPITPTFVLPYKRYAGPTLLSLAAGYLENDRQTYRETASPGGRARAYQTPPGTPALDARGLLDHSTVWRTLSWLGGQLAALTTGRQLLQQHNPRSTCHRFVGAVAPHKFRSSQREQLLRQSRQLLHLMAEWNGLFREKFFPRFATRSGFG